MSNRAADQEVIEEWISSLRINLDVINAAMRQKATSENVDVVSSLMLEVQETKDQLQAEAERLVEGGQYGRTDKIFEAISEVSHVESEFGEWSKAVEQSSRSQPQRRHLGDTAGSPTVDNNGNSSPPLVAVGKKDTPSQEVQRSEAMQGKQEKKDVDTAPKASKEPQKIAPEISTGGQQIFWPAAKATRGRSRRGASKRGKSRERKQQKKDLEKAAPAVSNTEDLGWPTTTKIGNASPTASAQEAIAAWDAFAAPDLTKAASLPAEVKDDSVANKGKESEGSAEQKKTITPTLPIPSKQNSCSSRESSLVSSTAVDKVDTPELNPPEVSEVPMAVTSLSSTTSGRMKISLRWEDVKDLYGSDKQEAKKAIEKQFVEAVSSSLHIDPSRVRVKNVVV